MPVNGFVSTLVRHTQRAVLLGEIAETTRTAPLQNMGNLNAASDQKTNKGTSVTTDCPDELGM
jgi:hypothetical protein